MDHKIKKGPKLVLAKSMKINVYLINFECRQNKLNLHRIALRRYPKRYSKTKKTYL